MTNVSFVATWTPGIKKADNSVEAKAAVRYAMSTAKTMILAVVAGVPKPRDWRQSEGGKWSRDMQTQRALWPVAVEIGSKGRSLLNRVSNVADPQTTTESRRG